MNCRAAAECIGNDLMRLREFGILKQSTANTGRPSDESIELAKKNGMLLKTTQKGVDNVGRRLNITKDGVLQE